MRRRQRSAAEANDTVSEIRDRKHHPLAEAVIGHGNVFAVNEEAGLDHVFDRNTFRAEIFLQREAFRGRIAHAKARLDFRRQPAVVEIPPRPRAGTRLQAFLEELRGQFHHVMERAAARLFLLHVGRDDRHRHAGDARKLLDSLGECEPLGLHYEAELVAVLPRGKAVIEALGIVHRERRRFFLIEGR